MRWKTTREQVAVRDSRPGGTNKQLGSLRIGSLILGPLRLVIAKTRIIKLVILDELKIRIGSVQYMLTSCSLTSLRSSTHA
jgi:hypothetical protein